MLLLSRLRAIVIPNQSRWDTIYVGDLPGFYRTIGKPSNYEIRLLTFVIEINLSLRRSYIRKRSTFSLWTLTSGNILAHIKTNPRVVFFPDSNFERYKYCSMIGRPLSWDAGIALSGFKIKRALSVTEFYGGNSCRANGRMHYIDVLFSLSMAICTVGD